MFLLLHIQPLSCVCVCVFAHVHVHERILHEISTVTPHMHSLPTCFCHFEQTLFVGEYLSSFASRFWNLLAFTIFLILKIFLTSQPMGISLLQSSTELLVSVKHLLGIIFNILMCPFSMSIFDISLGQGQTHQKPKPCLLLSVSQKDLANRWFLAHVC